MNEIWRWCPCGFLLGGTPTGSPSEKPCTCTAPQIRRYLSRISGPLLDRIDIHIEVPRLSSEELMGKRTGESSATVRRHLQCAHESQRVARVLRDGWGDQRFAQNCHFAVRFERARLRTHIKVSRTIADLEGAENIEMHHVAEAINYRAFDRKLFG